MASVVCVLKSGGEFKREHVETLRQSVIKHNPCVDFICLTDMPIAGINCIPLTENWPGWWSKIELFKNFKTEPILYLDLDTVVIGDLSELFSKRLKMLKDVNNLDRFGSGVMSWCGDYSYLYDIFKAKSDKFIREYVTYRNWGDQGFLMNHLKETPDSFDFGPVQSYKFHCKNGVPNGTKLVYFHGKPRPWEVNLDAIC